jgi:hypothetical protein
VAPANFPFVWSPDGKALVYAVQSPENDQVLHLLRGGVDKILGSIPVGAPGGCENIAGCSIANDLDERLSFSPDGQYISLVNQTFGGSTFRIWYLDGTLLKSDDTLGPTWSIWSGGGLYYRDGKGVEVWRDGTVKLFLPGVRWINPAASPAGGHITYTVRDANGWGHVYVVDTSFATTRELKAQRTEPFYLTPRYIWYRGERACTAQDGCGATPPLHPLSGKSYVYDLQDGTETESIITLFIDAWPHAA